MSPNPEPRERAAHRPSAETNSKGNYGPQPCKVSLTANEEAVFRAWGIYPDPEYGQVPGRKRKKRHPSPGE